MRTKTILLIRVQSYAFSVNNKMFSRNNFGKLFSVVWFKKLSFSTTP